MRIWNRLFTVKPVLAKKSQIQFHDNRRFYAYAVILFSLLRVIADGSTWHRRLLLLLNDYDDLPKNEMGFPENWYSDPFWQIEALH
jgi:abortive infection bacteriophage resistance protein